MCIVNFNTVVDIYIIRNNLDVCTSICMVSSGVSSNLFQ